MSKFLAAKKLICCGGKWKTFQNKIECNSQNKWPSFCLFTTDFLNNNKPNLLKIIHNGIRFRKIFSVLFCPPLPGYLRVNGRVLTCLRDTIHLILWKRWLIITLYSVITASAGSLSAVCSHWSVAPILTSHWSILITWLKYWPLIGHHDYCDLNIRELSIWVTMVIQTMLPLTIHQPWHEPGHHLTLSHTGQTLISNNNNNITVSALQITLHYITNSYPFIAREGKGRKDTFKLVVF